MTDRDAPTLTTCPACDGARQVCEEIGATMYRARKCEVCDGAGCCTAERAREWRERRGRRA